MDTTLIVIRVKTPSIQNPYKKEDYFSLHCQGEQVGFINGDGIFLRLDHPSFKEGVWTNVLPEAWKNNSPAERVALFKKHWGAIFDRYPLRIKFIH